MNLLRWQWRGSLDLDKFIKSFDYLAAFSQQHKVTRWLADTSDMPLVGIDEQVWLGEQWLPQFVELGVKKIGLVLPLSLHNVLVVEHLMFDAQHYTPSNVQFFSDTLAALDWLTDSAPRIGMLEQEWQQLAGGTTAAEQR
ncbi:hypothetical protein [Hymenobacter algoricola]